MSEVPGVDTFATNKIAAAVAMADDARLDAVTAVAGADAVTVYPADRAAELLEPDGFFERLRLAFGEINTAVENLRQAADAGETIVVVDGVDSDDRSEAVTSALVESGAGWVFRFDELTWSEVHTPASRRAAETD